MTAAALLLRCLYGAAFFCALATFVLALPANTGSGQLMGRMWTVADGLQSNTVFAGAQDGDGYIWLATPGGLSRFDGIQYKHFSRSSFDEFNSNAPQCLASAPDGTLWIGTKGDGLYALSRGIFNHFGADSGLPDLDIQTMAFDERGWLWLGTPHGISYFDGTRFHTVASSLDFGVPVFFKALSESRTLVASSRGGLWALDGQELKKTGYPSELDSVTFTCAQLDAAKTLWLGDDQGRVWHLNGKTISQRFSSAQTKSKRISTLFFDRDGTLWAGTSSGVIQYDGDSWKPFVDAGGMRGAVSSIFEDREGSLWIGYERDGLSQSRVGVFTHITRKSGLESDSVNSVVVDNYGSIWVGTEGGLSFLPSDRDPYNRDRKRKSAVDSLLNSLDGRRIRHIRRAADNSLWIATGSAQGLIQFTTKKTSSLGIADGLPSNRMWMSYEDRGGRLWISTSSGLVKKQKDLQVFSSDQGIPSETIVDILEDSARDVWAASSGGGVVRFHGETHELVGVQQGLAGSNTYKLYEDKAKRLWILTSQGISLRQDGRFFNLDASSGLLSDSIYQMMEDTEGQAWLLTNRGIQILALDDLALQATGKLEKPLTYRVLDYRNGLSGELNPNGWAWIDEQGIIYIPTFSGVSVYNPHTVVRNQIIPPVFVDAIEIDGKQSKALLGNLTVPAGANHIRFHYAGLSFVDPSKVRFQYKLEGYDTDWVEAPPGRTAQYTNISPGYYSFLVRAWNNDGVPNPTPARLQIQREGWFFQSFWFYALVILLIAAAGYVATRISSKPWILLRAMLPQKDNREKPLHDPRPMLFPEASVLYADVVDFTRHSLNLSPAQAIKELNFLFSAFEEICGRHGCETITTVGDSFVAACGIVRQDIPHGILICSAAVEMMQWMESWAASGPARCSLRIGISAGPVLAGFLGASRQSFDLLGDTVNVAQRVMGQSVPTGITLSADMEDLVRHRFELISRPLRTIRGSGDLQLFYIQYRSASPSDTPPLSATSALERIRELQEQKEWQSILKLIPSLDFSVMEPELAYRIHKLSGNAAFHSGSREEAGRLWLLALQIGIPDKTIEQNLAILNQH